jgi:hypothetical protein
MIDCVNACNLDAKRVVLRKLFRKGGLLPRQPESSYVASLERVTLDKIAHVAV